MRRKCRHGSGASRFDCECANSRVLGHKRQVRHMRTVLRDNYNIIIHNNMPLAARTTYYNILCIIFYPNKRNSVILIQIIHSCFSRHRSAELSESIEKHTEDPRIYNFVSSPENPLTWGLFSTTLMYYILHRPTAKAMWYPTLIMNASVFLHKITVLVLHYLPAFLLDLVFMCTGNKLRFVDLVFFRPDVSCNMHKLHSRVICH